MNFWKKIFFIGLLGILISSCTFSDDFLEDADAYKVNVSALNVRQQASIHAPIVGKLRMGDTVYVNESHKNWRKVLYNGRIAYVDGSYLTELVTEKHAGFKNAKMNETAKSFIRLIDKYANWKTWQFWLITVVMLITSYFLFMIGIRMIRGNDAVDFWVEHGFMGMNYLPYIALVVGFFFGIVYFFWPEDIQQALLIDPFWWFPTGKGFLCWYIWILGLITIISIFIFSIYDIITFRAFSIFRILYFLLLSGYIFIGMIFLASASIIILLIMLALEFIVSMASAGGSVTHVKKDDEGARIAKKRRDKRERRRIWQIRQRHYDEFGR